MRLFSVTMSVFASSAVALLAACSGSGSQSSALPGALQPTAVTRAASVQTASTLQAFKNGGSCPTSRVYVANFGYSEILIYGTAWPVNQAPCGRITTGVLSPAGIWLNAAGTLYVADYYLDAITEFKAGMVTPSRTLITQHAPWFAYAGKDGTVYASEYGGNQVEEFAHGATTATLTIPVASPWGIATDQANNLYVVTVEPVAGTRILKFAPGSTTGVDIGIALSQTFYVGLLITKNGTLIVGNSGVQIYAPGATMPTRSFASNGSYQMTLNSDQTRMYIASNGPFIYEYDFATGTLLATITNGLSDADGIAYSAGYPEGGK